jgi:type VI protein secretion system component VasF
MSPRPRPRFESMRQMSPGWAGYYEGLYSLWLLLPLWVRWMVAALVVVYCAWSNLH